MTAAHVIDTAEVRRQLDEVGYAVFRGVVDGDRLTELGRELADEFDRVKRSGELFAGGGSLTGHLNCFPGAQSRFVYDDLEH